MKKIILIVVVFIITGCTSNRSCEEIVVDYLNEYKNLSSNVTKNINRVINENKEFNDAHKIMYKDILINQYSSLKYNVISDEYSSDKALVKVNITVKDLNKAEDKAVEYLSKNLKDFYNEDNTFNKEKYISKKLELMANENEYIDYEIIFYLYKKNDKWILKQPSDEDLEKIHGIYKK